MSSTPLPELTREGVDRWFADLLPDRPTLRARSYALLKTVPNGAVDEDSIETHPCRIRGASGTRAVVRPVVLSPAEVRALADAMPDRLRLSVYLGVWCQIRQGKPWR